MANYIISIGVTVRDLVLYLAGLLVNPASPGLVTLALVFALLVCLVSFEWKTQTDQAAMRWLTDVLARADDTAGFVGALTKIEQRVKTEATGRARRALRDAWENYRETLVAHQEADGSIIMRNALRPGLFFNAEDLQFGPGFWRILPGLFVTIGLSLTFLGLIAALNAMDLKAGKIDASLQNLLTIASAKFIMSLTGLFCSIVFTVFLRRGMGGVDRGVNRLCADIEKRLSFISLEALAVEQLAAMREQREHFRSIGLELVAELGRPLREEIPNAISSSIASAMSPILDRVGQIGTDGMGGMVKDLSKQFSDDVARALTDASDKLSTAGDRIAELSQRMDQSSGRVGTEVDAAATRLSQAIDDLRATMGATAETASGALNQGAERLLSVMNQTLEGIRDNTGEGARAMSAAAAKMTEAAENFRSEMDAATRKGADAATAQMAATGADASGQIASAGRTVVTALDKSAADALAAANQFAENSSERLLEPLKLIQKQLDDMMASLKESASAFQRLSSGVQAGAAASETASVSFRSASQSLIEATSPVRAQTERIEAATRQLAASTEHVAATVARSAQMTAESAARTLAAADTALGGHKQAMDASFQILRGTLEKLQGQGDRMDDLDEKLGRAFELFNTRVQTAIESLTKYVKEIRADIDPAIDTMRLVVDQAEKFIPKSARIG